MLNFIVWLIAGAFIGWLAGRLMGTRGGLLFDIVVGVVGAFIAGWFITPLVRVGTINQNVFSLPALVVSLLGAIALLAYGADGGPGRRRRGAGAVIDHRHAGLRPGGLGGAADGVGDLLPTA